jgi:ribose/xylose/arabinose/galactoside ABC-type transport system permease subunit
MIAPYLGLWFTFLIFMGFAPAAFHSLYNLKTILTQSVIVGIGALGMTFIIISGGIDLSIGSLIALSTVLMARMLGQYTEPVPIWLPWVVCLAAIGIGAVGGWINGFLSARMRIVPFIVTLGTMQIFRGGAKWLAKEQTVMAPVTGLNSLMDIDPTPAWLILAPSVWMLGTLTLVVAIVLRYTVFGRHTYALESNEATARLCGINVERRRMLIYAVGGAMAGIAGIMQFANLTLGDPTAAEGMELDIIAAVVIGGGSLRGGEGRAMGSLIGAILMAVLRNGCNMAGIPNYLQNIVVGVIIIGAMGLDRLSAKK